MSLIKRVDNEGTPEMEKRITHGILRDCEQRRVYKTFGGMGELEYFSATPCSNIHMSESGGGKEMPYWL